MKKRDILPVAILVSVLTAAAAFVVIQYQRKPATESDLPPMSEDGAHARLLRLFKEPPLHELHAGEPAEQYRFCWLRTFHNPIAIRIWKESSGVKLRVVRLGGAAGYDPGAIAQEVTLDLTNEQWDQFLKSLEKCGFWAAPALEQGVMGNDGAAWFLEGQKSGNYHRVRRWSPTGKDDTRHLEDFAASCLLLLEFSKLQVPKEDVY